MLAGAEGWVGARHSAAVDLGEGCSDGDGTSVTTRPDGRRRRSHTCRLHARFHLRTRRRPLLSAFAGGHALCVSVSPCIFPARFQGSLLIRRDFGDLFSEQQKEGL